MNILRRTSALAMTFALVSAVIIGAVTLPQPENKTIIETVVETVKETVNRTVNTVTTAIVPVYVPQISEDIAEALERNPELEAYSSAFTGIEDYPSDLDISSELKKGEIPTLMQWDSRWGYVRYGSGLIGYTGCGPTALSMVLVGLTGNGRYHPAYVAKFASENGYCVVGNGTSWLLFSSGAEKLGLKAKELACHEGVMLRELNAGRPIIAIMGKGDFTEAGHFIVITGYEDGYFTVIDPYRSVNSTKGWDFETLEPQIRNLWSYEVK